MAITYLWGYNEIIAVSDKEFLPYFGEWMKNVKDGVFDNDIILLKRCVKQLEKVVRAVVKSKPPPDVYIGNLLWTLKDVYDHHPRGKDLAFWKELLDMFRARKSRDFWVD